MSDFDIQVQSDELEALYNMEQEYLRAQEELAFMDAQMDTWFDQKIEDANAELQCVANDSE